MIRTIIFVVLLLAAPPAAAQFVADGPSPPSLSQAARDRLSALAQEDPPAQQTIDERRAASERVQQQIGQGRLRRHNVSMREYQISGVPIREFTPQQSVDADAPILLNLHGGGFVVDAGSITENASISGLTGFRVIAVRYRLSPENAFPAALEDALAVYRELLKERGHIVVYGTSAGAILSAQLISRIRDEGLQMPVALGFFSGSGDLSDAGDTVGLEGRPTVEAITAMYLGGLAPTDVAASPERGDLTDFPPTLCLTSSRDYLLSATTRFCSKLDAAGVETHIGFYDGLPHAFWAYVDAPESDAAFARMAKFFRDVAGSSGVRVRPFTLPDSNNLSDEAIDILKRQRLVSSPDFDGDVAAARSFYQSFNDERLAEMRRHFSTSEQYTQLGGVPVHLVEPAQPVSPQNSRRVLINVHGGAFMWGSGSGALVEAIPIAATSKIRVVAVDYRLAPEHRYPAASEDVAAVYGALLKEYRPENIGIYGCSAGGVIAAQSVAMIVRQGLPRPGAVGTLCGTGAPYSGDSLITSGPLAGGHSMIMPPLPDILPTPYMAGIPASDTTAYPLAHDTTTANMPPTLLLAGGRDFAVSALTLAHRRLTRLGVASELHLFDGLPHAFFVWPDMPESMEAYKIIAGFFDRHLGQSAK